ncbi:MAG: MFS transporter [Atopobiaceae bacterium]|nr:MFS transporter [Atopobiaceae bacterium]
MSQSASRPTSSHMPLLVVMYASAFVAAFNENIINVALVDIMGDLSVGATTAQWLITGYMVLASIVTASMAFLSRRLSTRRLFFVASACLLVGEVACYVAPTFAVLLPCRIIQAIGSGMLFPLMMNVVLAVAPKQRMGLFLSIGGACITLGPAFGPVISGLAATLFGWRAIFVLPALAMAVLALVGVRVVEDVSTPQAATLDVPSLVELSVGLTCFVYGLSELTCALPLALGALVVALVVLALFVRRQGRIAEPLLDLRPMRNPRFWPACLLVVVAMMETFSMSVLLPLYFEGACGTDALVAGLLILPAIAVNAVTSVVGGRVMDARGEWPLLPVGFALVVVGQVLVWSVSESLAMGLVVAATVVVYAGVGLVLSPSQTAGLRHLSQDEYPHGTALLNTFVMIAASIGPSLFVGILSSGAASAAASGLAASASEAAGFAQAVLVAAVIGAAGLALSVGYARKARTEKAMPPQSQGPSGAGADDQVISEKDASGRARREGVRA